MYIHYWTIWLTLQCDLKLSIIISLPIQSLTWWFHFNWFLYIDKKNVKWGRGKGYRYKLRNFKHKAKHNIGCHPKYILIFTAYQVKWWCTMIISPLKAQPDFINVTEILLKSSWRTHLKNSKPYIFILQKVKSPQNEVFTHLFLDSSIILFLHRLYRLLKVKLNRLRVPTNAFSGKKSITRRENPNSSNLSSKARKKPPKDHTKNRPFVSCTISEDRICHILSSKVKYS